MAKFLPYNPDQSYLLPPSVKDVLGEEHLCFFIHTVVEKLDLTAFEENYEEEGRPAYSPALVLKIWLYAYALGLTSSRRLEQRVREDLGFRYLAGGAVPDHWTLNMFRKRHGCALNDMFTQVLEMARDSGLAKLGHVAIDSTRVGANASRHKIDSERNLRTERSRIRRQIRRWQKQCTAADSDEGAGMELPRQQLHQLKQNLKSIPKRLERLRKSGTRQLSRTDPDSRFLKDRRGFVLGYTAEVAVSEDHVIVAQRVTQNASDNASLVPLVDAVEQECSERPGKISADAAFFAAESVKEVTSRGIDVYVPDPHMARELQTRNRAKFEVTDVDLRRMRAKLRTPEGRRIYQRRKTIVEPVFGTLKEQRNLRRFRRRGLAAVAVEFTLAATAYNLTRLHCARTKATE